ncbi:MAG: MiaB/RimO family radical SAM methylthiotransferase [Elusimicrobiota bacterium]
MPNQEPKKSCKFFAPKVFIRTYGCQMNVADSDSIVGCLLNNGYIQCEKPEDANLIVVNTCTVRQHAEDRVLSYIGRLRKLKIKNQKSKIIVLGCVASRLKDTLKKQFPFVDEVIPAYDIQKFPQLFGFSNYLTTYPPIHLSSFVPISRGCSNYCSYCVVPFVRGEEISRPFNEIISDIKKLINSGRKEITLLGQNVNSYCSRAFSPNDTEAHKGLKCRLQGTSCSEIDFADLLREANEISEIEKVDFLTSHPKDFTDKIIDAILQCKKVSRIIHLPVQSGSNRILELMNRGYTADYYLALIQKIRQKIPKVSFTTDIIVGFPTETEADFCQTLKLINEVGFVSAFTFKYSPRENTKAFSISDDVPLEIKKARLQKLNILIQNIRTLEHQNSICYV